MSGTRKGYDHVHAFCIICWGVSFLSLIEFPARLHARVKELGEGGVFGNEIFCLCIPVSVFFSHFFIAGVRWVLFFLHRLFLSYFLVLGVGLFFFCLLRGTNGVMVRSNITARLLKAHSSKVRIIIDPSSEVLSSATQTPVPTGGGGIRSYYCTPCRTSERPAVHLEVLALPETTWSCCCRGSHSQWEASGQVRAQAAAAR
jgi:hypothetical protein